MIPVSRVSWVLPKRVWLVFLFLTDDRSNLLPDKENHVGIARKYKQGFRFGAASRKRDSPGSGKQTGVARAGLGGSSLEDSFGLGKVA